MRSSGPRQLELAALPVEDRLALVAAVGDRPETVLAVHALSCGLGRAWVTGPTRSPAALIVESALVPGEPMGFGDPLELIALLHVVEGWRCLEVAPALVDTIVAPFEQQWGLARQVVDVISVLHQPAPAVTHRSARRVTTDDLAGRWPDEMPHPSVTWPAVTSGRVFGAFDGPALVGQGGSYASSSHHADLSVHVASAHRGRGIATAAATRAAGEVQAAGLTPVWGAGSDNVASLAVARRLGFVPVSTLTYLVRASPGPRL